ncbi:hypothetical protein HN51_047307 [Arachis hypogaea]
MSNSHRKRKGKATTGKRKRGEASMSIIDLMHDASLREKNFTQKLYLERTLKIPEELQQYTSEQIIQRGWFFLERPLTEVNASWVREFYYNYFKTSLDAVNFRGKQILVTEEAIKDVLKLLPKTDQLDDYQKAEEDMGFM